MKFLAGITIVLSIPTMIASFFGMNVNMGFFGNNNLAILNYWWYCFNFSNNNSDNFKNERYDVNEKHLL
jgi:hypothetical protein